MNSMNIKTLTMILILCVVLFFKTSYTTKHLPVFYELPLLTDDYDNYSTRAPKVTKTVITKQDRPVIQYLKMNKEQFFAAMNNLSFKRVPKKVDSWSYKNYEENFNSYCEEQYMTHELFERILQTAKFKTAAKRLRECLNFNDVKNFGLPPASENENKKYTSSEIYPNSESKEPQEGGTSNQIQKVKSGKEIPIRSSSFLSNENEKRIDPSQKSTKAQTQTQSTVVDDTKLLDNSKSAQADIEKKRYLFQDDKTISRTMKYSADFRYKMCRAPSHQDIHVNYQNSKNQTQNTKTIEPYKSNISATNFHEAIIKSLNFEYTPNCCGAQSNIKQQKINKLKTTLQDKELKHLIKCFKDFFLYMPKSSQDVKKNYSSKQLIQLMNEDIEVQKTKPSMKWITDKDLQFLSKFVSDFSQVDSETQLDNMFMEYQNLRSLPTPDILKQGCKTKIMSRAEYTAAQICFWLIPSPYTHTNFEIIHLRRKTIVEYLKYIDPDTTNEKILYDPLIKELSSFENQSDYYNHMMKKRAIDLEIDYHAYVLRMRLLDIVPLPENLWRDERQQIEIYRDDVQKEDNKRQTVVNNVKI